MDSTLNYTDLYRLELERNYNNDITTVPGDVDGDVLKHINSNYDTFDKSELEKVALKCLSQNGLKQIILKHELKHYRDEPEDMELSQFKDVASKLLQRYHYKAGGFLLEDPDWVMHSPPDYQYGLQENEIVFINTINRTDADNEETDQYLTLIVERLQSLTKNIKVDVRYKKHHHSKTIHVLILCVDKNITVEDDPDIGI